MSDFSDCPAEIAARLLDRPHSRDTCPYCAVVVEFHFDEPQRIEEVVVLAAGKDFPIPKGDWVMHRGEEAQGHFKQALHEFYERHPELLLENQIKAFEEKYAANSKMSVRDLHLAGRFGETCLCGQVGCEGFQMGHQWEDAIIQDRLWRIARDTKLLISCHLCGQTLTVPIHRDEEGFTISSIHRCQGRPFYGRG